MLLIYNWLYVRLGLVQNPIQDPLSHSSLLMCRLVPNIDVHGTADAPYVVQRSASRSVYARLSPCSCPPTSLPHVATKSLAFTVDDPFLTTALSVPDRRECEIRPRLCAAASGETNRSSITVKAFSHHIA